MIGNITDIISIGESNVECQSEEDFLFLPIGIFVVGYFLTNSTPIGFAIHCFSNTEHDWLHTSIELTVDFFEIDDIETIGYIVTHVRYFEIEPLMIAEGIYIRTKNEIIFFFIYLNRFS